MYIFNALKRTSSSIALIVLSLSEIVVARLLILDWIFNSLGYQK